MFDAGEPDPFSLCPITRSIPTKMPMQIDLGGLTVVVEHYIGHTDTDLIFRVPEQNVIYTGRFTHRRPIPGEHQRLSDKVARHSGKICNLRQEHFVCPGHGQVMGQEGVAEMRSCFDDIAEQAEKSYKAGVPVEEAAERYVVPRKIQKLPHVFLGFHNHPHLRTVLRRVVRQAGQCAELFVGAAALSRKRGLRTDWDAG